MVFMRVGVGCDVVPARYVLASTYRGGPTGAPFLLLHVIAMILRLGKLVGRPRAVFPYCCPRHIAILLSCFHKVSPDRIVIFSALSPFQVTPHCSLTLTACSLWEDLTCRILHRDLVLA